MAITRTETQVTWSAANSATCGADTSTLSDVVSLDATCWEAQVSLKASNTTTAATDDQIYIWLLQSSGDPDGTGTAEYDTNLHGLLLGVLDTFKEQPAIKTAQIPLPQENLKFFAEGTSTGSTNAIVVSATITEHRAS